MKKYRLMEERLKKDLDEVKRDVENLIKKLKEFLE